MRDNEYGKEEKKMESWGMVIAFVINDNLTHLIYIHTFTGNGTLPHLRLKYIYKIKWNV